MTSCRFCSDIFFILQAWQYSSLFNKQHNLLNKFAKPVYSWTKKGGDLFFKSLTIIEPKMYMTIEGWPCVWIQQRNYFYFN